MALDTEKRQGPWQEFLPENQATEDGNNYDKNTRGYLFHLNRFGRIVTFCVNVNIIVYAFGLCFYQEALVLQIVQPYQQAADVLFEI